MTAWEYSPNYKQNIYIYGTKVLTYVKFTKDLKWLLKQLGLGTGYSSHSFRRWGKFLLQIDIPGEMIKLMN